MPRSTLVSVAVSRPTGGVPTGQPAL